MGGDSSKFKRSKITSRSEDVGVTTVNRSSSNVSNKLTPPAIKVGHFNSFSSNDNNPKNQSLNDENKNNLLIPRRVSSKTSLASNTEAVSLSRSGSSASKRSDSVKQRHPITQRYRQLISSCFNNPHENIGKRVMKRTCEKRPEYSKFYRNLDNETREEIDELIKVYIKKAVANIDFLDEVQRLSEEIGERFVFYRTYGFKADFFTTIADAIITECSFLDNAVHPAHMTLAAFSHFIGIMFTSVRNGFYNEIRRLRRSSNSFSMSSNGSFRHKKLSYDSTTDISPRSLSPSQDSRISDEAFIFPTTPILSRSDIEENKFLKPPRSNSMIVTRGC
ncbi:Globin-like domain and Globin, structural domain-containing protein [Strongyloides ratti]|uniref:Globin-like domain and Globin, structural domain-containing protein n=1 Tax=Strongyloides ratti TaxID=34506 RepID=A0A090LLI8_STRRB|nr:Globin-like domain and Globin, structural domain-containing protein [Strongyloides ratti]CEF68410.1 Globin-like domain and Globin, structural domain-containing protein [Strongyloides ratti]